MVRLFSPLLMLGDRKISPFESSPPHAQGRQKRGALRDHFDLMKESPTYYIGISRSVPNQYKLADQIAAGFENLPLLAAIFPITPNKNVDRINYIHYNVLRLANLTRDAIEGIAEQLAPTSLMAVQNRLALDMVLAEKGGVCAMFGDMCCTFIPNNTAPDSKVTRALEGLRALSKTMHEHSGVENPFEDWMSATFGKWKALIMSIMISAATVIGILVTCGCCCVPCLRSLCSRLIVATIEGKDSRPALYQMTLLPENPPELESISLAIMTPAD